MGTMNAAVAAVLRGELRAADMTQKQLADASGIPQVTIQRLLKGTRAINVDTLDTLATALGTTPGRVVRAANERLTASPEEVEARRAMRRELDLKARPKSPPGESRRTG